MCLLVMIGQNMMFVCAHSHPRTNSLHHVVSISAAFADASKTSFMTFRIQHCVACVAVCLSFFAFLYKHWIQTQNSQLVQCF